MKTSTDLQNRYKALRRDEFKVAHNGSHFVVTHSLLDDFGPGNERGLHMTPQEEGEFWGAMQRMTKGML